MITMKYIRLVATPNIVYTKSHEAKTLCEEVYDHDMNIDTENALYIDLSLAKSLAHDWLEDHYGFVVISINGLIHIRIGNREKMTKDLRHLGLDIKIRRSFK